MKKEMKNIVLVFTNYVSWECFGDQFNDCVNEAEWSGRYKEIERQKLFRCSVDEDNKAVLVPVDVDPVLTMQEGVYLVYDCIEDDKLSSILERNSGCNLCMMVHTKGIEEKKLIGFCTETCRIMSGMHDTFSCYYEMFDILTDDKDDKTARAVDLFKSVKPFVYEELEMDLLKVKFLYLCAVPGNDLEVFKGTCLHRRYESLMDDYIELYNCSNKCEDYQEKFQELHEAFYSPEKA